MLIDTHCHLDFDRFDEDRNEVVSRMITAGVKRVIVPALDPDNWHAVLDLADQYDSVYAAVGVHPNSCAGWTDEWINTLEQKASHPKVVAIGEIGLDYYWNRAPQDVQRHAFALQLGLAAKLNLPVIVHNRESDRDVLSALAACELAGKDDPGVLHSFSGDRSIAREALAMGYCLGFTGPVTYKNAVETRHVAAMVAEEKTLIETDAPFLAPQQHRGRRNEPAYVTLVAEKIAEVRQVSPELIAEQTTRNARRLFGDMGLTKDHSR